MAGSLKIVAEQNPMDIEGCHAIEGVNKITLVDEEFTAPLTSHGLVAGDDIATLGTNQKYPFGRITAATQVLSVVDANNVKLPAWLLVSASQYSQRLIYPAKSASVSVNYNASESSIRSTLSAFSVAFENVEKVGAVVRFDINFEPDAADLLDTSGLTPSALTSESAGAQPSATRLSLWPSVVTIVSTAHGLTTGDVISLKTANGEGGTLTEVTVLDADTYTIAPDERTAELAGLFTVFDSTGKWYVGPKEVNCRRVHVFYQPGITPGITTPEDIPQINPVNNKFLLLKSIVDGETEITIDVGPLEQIYPGCFRRILTKVSVKDLYD